MDWTGLPVATDSCKMIYFYSTHCALPGMMLMAHACHPHHQNVPRLLLCEWTMWFSMRSKMTLDNYEDSIHAVGTLAQLDDVWMLLGHLKRPSDLPGNSDYHLFRTGIKPMWEDGANASGGKWMVRLRKSLTARLWEHLVLAALGGELDGEGEEVCGVVLSVRYHEDILSVWNRRADDGDKKERLRERFRRVLSLPAATVIEYKAHNQALRDHSSFRNTTKTG